MQKSVITVAVGKAYYKELSMNLYRSFIHSNADNDIYFQIVTDEASYFDEIREYPKLQIIQPSDISRHESFTSKFTLFECSVGNELLFIDCDCLIYSDLSETFNKFSQHNFSAVGNNITQGEFFCNVKEIILKFGIQSLPKFVGSIYYFQKNEQSEKIFQKAQKLKVQYDALGFVRLRGKENEEPLFSVSMALFGESLIENDGHIKADLMFYNTISVNVLKGKARVSESKMELTGGEIIPEQCSPAIIHFNDSFTESVYYKKEVYRLNSKGRPAALNEAFAFVIYDLPFYTQAGIKSLLRPLYHRILGPRTIKRNKRV